MIMRRDPIQRRVSRVILRLGVTLPAISRYNYGEEGESKEEEAIQKGNREASGNEHIQA